MRIAEFGQNLLTKSGFLCEDHGLTPDQIVFMAGELIRDDAELRRDIFAETERNDALRIIIIDEVNYVKDWDKAVKFLVDSGALDQTVLLLSGSDSAILRDAMKRFAGRRGNARQVDFVFHPLGFAETVSDLRNLQPPDFSEPPLVQNVCPHFA